MCSKYYYVAACVVKLLLRCSVVKFRCMCSKYYYVAAWVVIITSLHG